MITENLLFHKTAVFITELEEYRENAYLDSGGVWTYGIGFTKTPTGQRVKNGDRINIDDCKLHLMNIILNDYYKIKNLVKVSLSVNQWTALLSFVYNISVTAFAKSTILKMINNNSPNEIIIREFSRWVYDNGQVVNGLKNRRKKEIARYLS